MKLYEINDELQVLDGMMEEYASEHEGEIPDFLQAELDRLEGERADKLLSIAAWIKGIEAEAEAIKAEKIKLGKRQSALESKAGRLRGYIETNLKTGETLKDPRTVIGWRRSEVVCIDVEPSELPDAYRKISYAADKDALKRDIKAGGIVTVAHIEERHNLQIK